MSKWLVTINDEGIQGQFNLGNSDLKQSEKEEKNLMSDSELKAKIIFVFKFGKLPSTYQDEKTIKDIVKSRQNEFYKEKGSWNSTAIFGYKMRQSTLPANYIEIMVDLDGIDDVNKFYKKYHGLDGAISLLYNTESVLHGAGKDASKSVYNYIQRLELIKSQEEDN